MQDFAPVTLGRTVSSEELSGFVLTDTIHDSNVWLASHAHANAAVSIVTKGMYHQYFRGGEITCTPGSVLIEPAEREHQTRYAGTAARTFIFEILPQRQAHRPKRSRDSEQYRTAQSSTIVATMEQLAAELSATGTRDDSYLHFLAIDVSAELSCIPAHSNGKVLARRVRGYLVDHFATGVRLDDVAAEVGRHPMHICKAFRADQGVSIGDFIRALQIRAALRELSRTSLPLSEIALNAGFADQSHFGRVFRAHVGLTPRAYRNLAAR